MKKKKMVPTSAPVTRKFQQIPGPLAPALILVSEASFCMTQVIFKLLPLIWNLEQMSLHTSPSKTKSCIPTPFQLSKGISPTGFQSQILLGLSFLVQAPQAGKPILGLRPLSP